MSTPLLLAGIGKIARDQHVPAIEASPRWALTCTVSRSGTVEGVPAFTDLEQALAAHPDIRTVSLCHPPVPRFEIAQTAIAAGCNVMLEKPPGATLAEVDELARMARARGVTLFTSWHSRMARGVPAAKAWLAGRDVTAVGVRWLEDIRQWHPGQDWVFEPGGMGVFDPGSNALSILTEVLPMPFHLREAELDVPANRQTPVAARLSFSDGIEVTFDWLHTGDPVWEITVETPSGTLVLQEGGDRLLIDEQEQAVAGPGEYPALYERLAELVETGESEVDISPMVHLADAMTLGRRIEVAPFEW